MNKNINSIYDVLLEENALDKEFIKLCIMTESIALHALQYQTIYEMTELENVGDDVCLVESLDSDSKFSEFMESEEIIQLDSRLIDNLNAYIMNCIKKQEVIIEKIHEVMPATIYMKKGLNKEIQSTYKLSVAFFNQLSRWKTTNDLKQLIETASTKLSTFPTTNFAVTKVDDSIPTEAVNKKITNFAENQQKMIIQAIDKFELRLNTNLKKQLISYSDIAVIIKSIRQIISLYFKLMMVYLKEIYKSADKQAQLTTKSEKKKGDK